MDARGLGRAGLRKLHLSDLATEPARFEPPRLTTAGTGRITRSAAEASALAEAREAGRQEARAEMAAAREAAEAARAAMERAAQALTAALDRIEHVDLGTLHDFEQQVLALGVSVAEELVGREVRLSDDVVLAAVGRALNLVPDRGPVLLRVHPADVAAVVESAAVMGHRGGDVQVVADAGVAPGGCLAEIGALRVDAQLPTAFARLREAFSTE